MLDALLGSATRARLLTILLAAPLREHHLREPIRLVGGGSSGVQREVDRFEKLGLLQTRRSNEGRRLVMATESHPLLEPLRRLIAVDMTGTPRDSARPNEDAAGRWCTQPSGPASTVWWTSCTPRVCARPRSSVRPLRQTTTPSPADLDVVVRLGGPLRGRAARYFALRRALERVSGLPVDLVEDEAVDNPYLREESGAPG